MFGAEQISFLFLLISPAPPAAMEGTGLKEKGELPKLGITNYCDDGC
jgi:hypothetical protein